MDALVSCVEADTCSAEADDCSATAATSPTSPSARRESERDLLDGGGDLRDLEADALDGGADGHERLARLLDGGDAVLGAGRAVARRRPRRGAVSRLHLADQAGDLAGRDLGLLGQLAHLVGDDGEPRALLAGAGGLDGGVEGEQVRLLGQAR